MNLVSIIIPTYNNANTICRAVDSCINQTYKNIEIIVIDDGSTDNTKEILSKYKTDERFKYIYQENQERSVARNHGLDIAKGEYIQFLDSDDEIYLDKIEKQVEFLKKNIEYFMVYCGVEYIDKNGKCISTLEKGYNDIILTQLLKGNFIAIHAPLIRKNDIRFNVNSNRLEDWEYWILSIKTKKVGYIDKILCVVNVEEQMKKDYILTMIKNEIKIYDKLLLDESLQINKLTLYIFKYKRYISLILKKIFL